MFEAKHRSNAPPELLRASDKAFAHGPTLFAIGQASGDVIAGDPGRLSLLAFATLQGLITIAINGKFKGISIQKLGGEMMARIISGLDPR